jgi:hypothetical protein
MRLRSMKGETMKPYQHYACALLKNPEWLKVVAHRYGNNNLPTQAQLACAISDLLKEMKVYLDGDEVDEKG